MYTLIIVDDDELIRKGLERVIQWEKLGFHVAGTFSKASDALDYLKSEPADVLLTDIKMPQMNGLELIDEARKYQKNLKSVIISGYGEFELAKQALLLRVEDYLLKPLGEEEIEITFLNIKRCLDEEQTVKKEERLEMKTEYELMRLLNHRVRISNLFLGQYTKKKYYEMMVIKLLSGDIDGEWLTCAAALGKVLKDFFFVSHDGCFACLISPEQLDGCLKWLKRVPLGFPQTICQIFIGKEVCSEAEVVSCYWSAVELGKIETSGGVFYYDGKRSSCKKEWNLLQNLKNRMVADFEDGRFQEIDVYIEQIDRILSNCDSKDKYYFYSDMASKIARYFELDYSGTVNQLEQPYPEPEQIKRKFRQDIETIRKTLWENSDTMRNLIVGKAKVMIEERYADEELSLAFVANHLNISYGYLSTIFTKIVGYSFKTYLVEVRMEKARQLLLSRQHRIYEIAKLVGYKNPRYFTDAFKRYYQCSPMDYIARFRGKE